ncbi:ABC transporter substrate-binding protein [Parasporobacterium paucivorans]|uniref:Branched-chain amino acid transport system substrate-binding protein n=1 Tax=Parasporobacterium paucivorans DSM 15970 TaxID=1122934 RepID=A0A1M6GY38_9FIRM|nr:ABC transporter substrate-binding protein [Parasporobacterium paucivorans]SHJ14824.1 branched-chain amino acid transport system substrate-binding protein [Parasporobacterium paucivorans DSM 15970]
MKSRFKRILAATFSMIMVLGSLSGCGSSGGAETTGSGESSTAQGELTISVLSAITGPIAFVGKPAAWAAEYAAGIINEAGGINGKTIKIDMHDTKFDTAEAVSAMSQVVDDALVVVGPMDAPGGEAAGQVAFDASVTNIAAFSFPDIRAQYSPFAIAYMTDSEEGDLLAAKHWVELNPDIKSIVVFANPTDPSQMATAEMLESGLPEVGVTVKKIIEVETGVLDAGPAAVQAINADVDGYYIGIRADEAAKVVSELRTRGVDEGNRICATFAAFSPNYSDVVSEDALNGTYIWNKLDPNYDGEEWNKLVEAYKADNEGASPTVNPVPDYYNALMAIKQCFEELNITGDPAKLETEKAAIAEWFYNSPVIEGIQGEFQWVEGKKVAPVYFFQFEGKQPVAVK